jgi:putative transposase
MPEYRRRLPHLQPENAYLFRTWRLWGSLPPKADPTVYRTPGHAFMAQDRALDRHCFGPAWLRHPPIADIVARAIQAGHDERQFYGLSAWVVMPNHVHMLILPKVPVAVLMRWLKGSTAREANRILGRTRQPFWQDESYDHYLRQEGQIHRTITYIEQSPVTAGLSVSAEDWPWSSASWQAKPPAPPNLPTCPAKM